MRINVVAIAGRLTKDPEIKETNNSKVANFSIAVDAAGDYNSEEKTNDVGFFEVEAWGDKADFAEKYLKKGKPIFIEGSLKQHKYKNSDSQTRNINKIKVKEFSFLPLPKRDDEDTDTQT